MALAEIKYSTLEARQAAMGVVPATGWSADARADAASRLAQVGLPSKRDEYWKYTDPTLLIDIDPTAADAMTTDEAPMFDAIDRIKLVFVDGVFDAAASDDMSVDGATIEVLSEVMEKDIHWAKDLYGTLEAAGQTPVARPLAILNTAYATQGVLIHVTGNVSKPINLIYRHSDTKSDAYIRSVIKVDTGASVTILENGPVAARCNMVMEVDVADNATVNHARVQGRDHDRQAVTHCFARLGHESVFKSFTLTVNGVMTRNECVLELTGDDAKAHVAGAAVGDGNSFHHDDTVFVTHDAVNCESRQVFKKVLRNGATGVFQGKILVKAGAQKTDGYQISQSLLLDDDSQFLAKPELEIYADDVICSHGSTTGAIDEDALFYLRSRGVPTGPAQDLLVLAFLAEAIDEIESEEVADDMLSRLEGWLERRRS
jgi:Fe-S cluster assembly protein SufD